MENNSNNFGINFICYSEQLLDLSDGKLITEDGYSFPIHKFMLTKTSKCFFELFCSVEEGKEDILISGIKGEDLRNILCYLYTGNIHVTENNILDLIMASLRLQLDDLLYKLKEHTRKYLSVTNSVPIFKICLELHRDDISRECFRFIQTHFETIVRCEDSKFSELPLDALRLMLRDKNLRVTSENIVWLSIIKWVEADTHNRLAFVPELLKRLSISDIDENMASGILQHDIVAKNPFCQEVHHAQTLISDADNLTALQCYVQAHIEPVTALFEHRQPSKVHFIARNETRNELIGGIQVYLTYDENIDLWRNLFEIQTRPRILLLINDCIYMFQISLNNNLCYNIIEKQWNALAEFRIPRYAYKVVELNGFVYILGGFSEDTGEEICDVEFYDSETEIWCLTMPMLTVTEFSAVSYNNIIYILGHKESVLGKEMVAQAFDSVSETWIFLPSPSCIRMDFTMVVYHGTIYVIGGVSNDGDYLKDVEVFDPIKSEWSTEVNLPNAYLVTKAIILNDKLIVYDNRSCIYIDIHPPVQWNVRQRCWETLVNSSMKNLHRYKFLTLENSECISIISRENKDSATVFEDSPFS